MSRAIKNDEMTDRCVGFILSSLPPSPKYKHPNVIKVYYDMNYSI
jgi:hypothetical protein